MNDKPTALEEIKRGEVKYLKTLHNAEVYKTASHDLMVSIYGTVWIDQIKVTPFHAWHSAGRWRNMYGW